MTTNIATVDFSTGAAWDDIEDSSFSSPREDREERSDKRTVDQTMAVAALQAPNAVYQETCVACKGTGRFISWAGRPVGQCFKCKGKGKKSFATSPDQRAASKEYVAARKLSKVEQFKKDFPAEHGWLAENAAKGNEFAASLLGAVSRFGGLTEGSDGNGGQLGAVRKALAKAAVKIEEKAANNERQIDCDVSKIQLAFDKARENFVPRPRMNLGAFTFKRAPDTGQNPGAIYVTEGTEYLGKITGGKLFPVIACTDARKEEIAQIAVDPYASAIAYGVRTRNCAICSRSLIVTESVDRGIGPICAEKYGWA